MDPYGKQFFKELLIQLYGYFGGFSLWCCWIILCYKLLFLIFYPSNSWHFQPKHYALHEARMYCISFSYLDRIHWELSLYFLTQSHASTGMQSLPTPYKIFSEQHLSHVSFSNKHDVKWCPAPR